MRPVVFEDRDITGLIFVGLMSLGAVVLFAFTSKSWVDLTTHIAHVLGNFLPLVIPLLAVWRHRRRQDRILDRIRAVYVMATGLLMAGKAQDAAQRLATIRRLEWQWRFGASYVYRIALFSGVLAANMVASLLGRVMGHYHLGHPKPATVIDAIEAILTNPLLFWLTLGLALFFALIPALDTAHIEARPWAEFYGDRLAAALNAGRGVEAAPHHEGRQLPPDGVSARELLGLSPGFTKSELRRAWLRLAREFHPDRWGTAPPAVRSMKEAALKRVNAARDELMTEAR